MTREDCLEHARVWDRVADDHEQLTELAPPNSMNHGMAACLATFAQRAAVHWGELAEEKAPKNYSGYAVMDNDHS